jgi:hypothetical protein
VKSKLPKEVAIVPSEKSLSHRADQLGELIAKQEILEVNYRYARGLDRMDRELTSAVFHPGATVDYGQFYEGTATGFVDWVFDVHAGFWRHAHQVHNLLVEFEDAQRAVSEAYYTVTLRRRVKAGSVSDQVWRCRYFDRLSLQATGWGIDSRTCYSEIGMAAEYDLPPDLDGSSFPARRDRDDASYRYLSG